MIWIKYVVHFFVDDYRFNGIYKNPERMLENVFSEMQGDVIAVDYMASRKVVR